MKNLGKNGQVDISYVDDDEPTEQVRQSVIQDGGNGVEMMKSSKGSQPMQSSEMIRPGFNPTEAILATMQLLPLPCAKAGMHMTADEIERNVSVIRSYAQGQQADLHQLIHSCGLGGPLRRKSKSQTGLNDLKDPGKTSSFGPSSGLCDLDELRSFQRQLQNFPSLSELRRHPVQNWLTSTSYRRSLSPATSSRWLDVQDHIQDGTAQTLLTTNAAGAVEPMGQQQQQPLTASTARPSFSRSTSRSSSESRGAAHNTESYALAILQILQVPLSFSFISKKSIRFP